MSSETQWRWVGEDVVPVGRPSREVGEWTDEGVARTAATLEREWADGKGLSYGRVYLERREVTYSDPVRVELAADGKGDDA